MPKSTHLSTCRQRRHVSAVELCYQSKASYRQVDYWVRKMWLHSCNLGISGSGSGIQRRRFPVEEIAIATWMVALIQDGVGPETASRMAHDFYLLGYATLAGARIDLPVAI